MPRTANPKKTVAETQTPKPKLTRGRRSREATRHKLIEAALRVIARKGVDNTAINDITEEADVGFGSFYNHFKSKQEIAQVAFDVKIAELKTVVELITQKEPDKAVAVAYIQKLFLTKPIEDPLWGWFIIHASVGVPELWSVFSKQGINDMREGIKSKRFSIDCVETAMRIILAALLSTMRATLEGEIPPSAADETVECLLRMMGLPHKEAATLSKKPLPKYVLEEFDNVPQKAS